jgi:hypothetical protein
MTRPGIDIGLQFKFYFLDPCMYLICKLFELGGTFDADESSVCSFFILENVTLNRTLRYVLLNVGQPCMHSSLCMCNDIIIIYSLSFLIAVEDCRDIIYRKINTRVVKTTPNPSYCI